MKEDTEDKQNDRKGPGNLTEDIILYDGECSICTASTEKLKALAGGSLKTLPLQKADSIKDLIPADLDLKTAIRKEIHVIKKDGTILKGPEAMRFIFSRTPFKMASFFLALPVIRELFAHLYYAFARNRHIISSRLSSFLEALKSLKSRKHYISALALLVLVVLVALILFILNRP